jgi:signal transduction histidine kinase
VAKQLTEELREKNVMLDHKVSQLRQLALELTQTEERERKRLAVLLHDDVQQFLAAASMKISLIDQHASSEEHGRMVRSALDLIGAALNSSRSLATDLYPPAMINGGFLPGLRCLAERMKERYGLTVELSGEEMAGMSSELSMLLFRGVRELLFNVVKHAGVKTASVAVNQPDAKAIQVVVTDHGVGFPGNHTKVLSTCRGLGMFHLRERLANIGGSLDVASVPGRGTTVSVTVPIG